MKDHIYVAVHSEEEFRAVVTKHGENVEALDTEKNFVDRYGADETIIHLMPNGWVYGNRTICANSEVVEAEDYLSPYPFDVEVKTLKELESVIVNHGLNVEEFYKNKFTLIGNGKHTFVELYSDDWLIWGDDSIENDSMTYSEYMEKFGRTDKAETPEEDMINHPSHYNSYSFEVIDIIDEVVPNFDSSISGHVQNAIKYIFRAPFKGTEIDDLKKAAWYLNHAIEWEEKMQKIVPQNHEWNFVQVVVDGDTNNLSEVREFANPLIADVTLGEDSMIIECNEDTIVVHNNDYLVVNRNLFVFIGMNEKQLTNLFRKKF